MVKYVYDAWGYHKVYNPDGTVNSSSSFIGNQNPFRYRGYYYDVETKFYYLQSRYYDPETCRFINIDSIDYADPETLGGLNLFAYCNNNPVMNVDPSGHSFWNILKAVVQVVAIVGAVIVETISAAVEGRENGLIEDFNNGALNPENTDPEVALNSNVISFYNGELVIRHSIPGATSCQIFGTIFLNSRESYNDAGVTTLNHEYGHGIQEKILGPAYLLLVATPSLYYNLTGDYKNYNDREIRERMYYSKIWERGADWHGGVNRNNYIPFWSWENFIPW